MSTASTINSKIKEAKANKDHEAIVFWNDIKWMSTRRSMKNWTLAQLIARHNEVSAEHNITVEVATL